MSSWFMDLSVQYMSLPVSVRAALTIILGLIVAYLVFKLVLHVVEGVVRAVVAAVLVFLLTTVPGNMLLARAYDQVQKTVSTSQVDM